jgi:chaperonin cofactor prefoldin
MCTPRCAKAEAADEVGKKTEYLKCKITELETNTTRIPEPVQQHK